MISLPRCNETILDFTSVLSLCMLWCSGDIGDKVQAFYMCLYPPPGKQDAVISITNENLPIVLQTLF